MFSRAIPAVRRVLVQGASASVRTSSAQFQRVVASSVRPTVQVATFSAEIIPGYGKGKTSTGIVGLPVDQHAVENMVVKYQALLDRMAASDMPETAQYRIDVEKIARYRIKIAMENPDDADLVEDLCQCGQVEELVVQAEDEMEVLEMYLETRMWELVEDNEEDNIETNPDPSKDHVGYEEEEEEAAAK